MTVRAAAVLAALGAALTGLSPAGTWFTADVPSGTVTITGLGADGALWTLPILGALGVAIAIALAVAAPPRGTPESRWGGGALIALGAMSAFWALAAILDPPVVVAITDGGVERAVALDPGIGVAAALAPLGAAVAAGAGLVIVWPDAGRR